MSPKHVKTCDRKAAGLALHRLAMAKKNLLNIQHLPIACPVITEGMINNGQKASSQACTGCRLQPTGLKHSYFRQTSAMTEMFKKVAAFQMKMFDQ